MIEPLIQAEIERGRGNVAEAIRLSESVRPYDHGIVIGLTSKYVRGNLYLHQRMANEAAAEFQKILDNPAIDAFSPLHAMSHLCLGRAKAMAGDTAGARKAYQDFFAVWKDADPDLPVLTQARKEYEQLR
jgi:predicted Zn-dependent protease